MGRLSVKRVAATRKPGMYVIGNSGRQDVNWNRRNMVIVTFAMSLGLGLRPEPQALQYPPPTTKLHAAPGILPAALPRPVPALSRQGPSGGCRFRQKDC